MNLHLIDWLVVAIPMVVVLAVAAYTQRHVKCVSDFMSGGRIAGRYLVAVSDGVAAMGLITIVAFFELYYKSGFAVNYWAQLTVPVTLLLSLTGFVFYRFRETRALTLAQFFELRYSRNFRLFAGWLSAIAGVINYGLFPAVAAKFFVYYVNLPESFHVLGIKISTYGTCMFVFLAAALLIVLRGGQVAIMVSDCLQGMFTFLMFLVVTLVVLSKFSWGQMCEVMKDAEPGHSRLNPFDSFAIEDFNIWFALIGVVGTVYITMAWQGNQGYNCAAANPHEAKMGKILGGWRTGMTYALVILLAIAALTFVNHESFATESQAARETIDQIDNPAIRTQVEVPVAVAHFLPPGVSGLFLATMLFLMLSTDTTYLHSWGSIIVQDVVLPLRGKPFKPNEQLWYLRWSAVGVAVFAFFFSVYYSQKTYILMFFAITGTIYLGGAGSCIIGGLYWKRGTTKGAWAAMFVGIVFAVAGFAGEHGWASIAKWLLTFFPNSEFLLKNQEKFFVNSQVMWFFAFSSAIVTYVVVSLHTCREPFNMDRLLHRGRYARQDDRPTADTPDREPSLILRAIGIDREHSRKDKAIAYFVFSWSIGLFCIWLVATVWNLVDRWPNEWWEQYFLITGVGVSLVGSVISSVWFTWGGICDLRKFFKGLATLKRNYADDGTVIDGVNADDVGES